MSIREYSFKFTISYFICKSILEEVTNNTDMCIIVVVTTNEYYSNRLVDKLVDKPCTGYTVQVTLNSDFTELYFHFINTFYLIL